MAFYHSLAYEASAGSGKTFALVIRYISLLYLDAKPSSILALTFTNKAANEMKNRISTVLKELHLPKREAELEEISKTLNIPKEKILEKQDTVYRRYLVSELKISTIDKFFSQVLRLFSQHLGLMPDFSIEEINDKQRFVLKFISNIKKNGAYRDLVLFSARESKRLGDIFSFLSHLYTKEAELSNIKIENETDVVTEKEILLLVESLRYLFKKNDHPLSQRAEKTLLVQNIDELLSKGWICKDSLNYWDYRNCYTEETDRLLKEIKSKLASYLQNRNRYLLKKYFNLYNIYKDTILHENISSGTLSFNDVTNLLFGLLHKKIDSDFLYFRLDSKIDHLLIDEFQDTNIVQYKILEPIIEEIHAGAGSSDFKTFFYVGDIKQSIYRFRGGAKELFHHVSKRFGVNILKLDTNYRSSCNIVTFVNETFKNIIGNYSPQKCFKKEKEGYIKVTTAENLTDSVCDELFSLLKSGVKDDDIAVLTYTNSDAFLIEEALLKRDKNLKVTTQTTAKLINTPYVSAITELLKYIYFKEEICKINFLTAVGSDWNSKVDLCEFHKYEDPALLIKKIVTKFDLPGDDTNILKFLEIAFEYKDLEEFLFQSEELDIDSPLKKNEGIKILTVHKSKGLEFSHVILCDRFKKKSPNRSTLIFSYDDIELEDLFIRVSKRECMDQKYKNALEHEKRLAHEDDLNLLYVAFTRAKDSLVICQNSENSAFELLNLTDMQKGELKPSAHKRITPDKTALTYKKLRVGAQKQKKRENEKRDENISAVNFGNALHYMLEILEEFKKENIESAYWAMKNRFEQMLEREDAKKIKKRVRRLLDCDEFCRLTEGKISKEVPVSYKGELKQIDLLIKKKEHFVIIDYKSSSQIRSEHKSQVRAYKRAVSSITGKKTLAYLCYIREDDIELVCID